MTRPQSSWRGGGRVAMIAPRRRRNWPSRSRGCGHFIIPTRFQFLVRASGRGPGDGAAADHASPGASAKSSKLTVVSASKRVRSSLAEPASFRPRRCGLAYDAVARPLRLCRAGEDPRDFLQRRHPCRSATATRSTTTPAATSRTRRGDLQRQYLRDQADVRDLRRRTNDEGPCRAVRLGRLRLVDGADRRSDSIWESIFRGCRQANG